MAKKGYRKPRVKRPVEKNVPPNYDSNWEHELHTGLLKQWQLHVKEIDYIIKHKYEPDFVKVVKKVLPPDIELVFLFANPSAPMPQAKRRKDGTKRSHGEWASANGFKWYSEDSLPDEWVDTKHRKDHTLNIESE